MIQGLYFGALINYRSPIDEHLTRCVYVRKENEERAIVLFAHADRVAKVDFEQLEWPKEPEDTIRGMKEYLDNKQSK